MLGQWTKDGGTLIITGSALSLAKKLGVSEYKTIPAAKGSASKDPYRPYGAPSSGGNNIDGVILKCNVDITSPLGYGYTTEDVAIMKSGTRAFDISGTNGTFPVHYAKEPYLSGCISAANLKRLAYTPACFVNGHGSGTVIYFSDDLNYRSYWFGTTKLFMNAVFFGQLY